MVKTAPPKYHHKSSHLDGQCGCGPCCSPSWLQWIRWPPIIVIYLLIVGLVMFLNNFYFGSVLSTIERRFGLSSSQSGLLTVIDNLTSMVVVVFISYLAERTSRPIVFALSILSVMVGNICITLPHFLSDPLDVDALRAGQLVSG